MKRIAAWALAAGLLSVAQGASIAYLNESGVTDLSDGTVTVDVQGTEPLPGTSLITWTGKAYQRGTAEFVPADPNSRLTFRLDAANRRLVVAAPSGTTIIIR